MTANNEREGDAFGQLPEELRIKIIKLLPDLLSLQELAHASPAMGRTLNTYPVEIVEVVLEYVPEQTRRLMGGVLKARFSLFPASLSDAQKVAKIDSTVASKEMCLSGLDQAATVQSFTATTENVHAWSHACLEHLIQKSMELRPSTRIEDGPGRTIWEQYENAESRQDYLPKHTGPPSWLEEQRMIKSFWRLQFFSELHGASLGNYWPGEEVEALSKSSPGDFYDAFDFEREQILTAWEFFNAVTSGVIPSVTAVHDAYGLPKLRGIEELVPTRPCAVQPFFARNKDYFYQGPANLDAMPMSYRYQEAMSILDQFEDAGPALLVFPFQPWRKYGFAIWDCKRMADLGMRDPKGKSYLRNYIKFSFRWFSILTEEDLRNFP